MSKTKLKRYLTITEFDGVINVINISRIADLMPCLSEQNRPASKSFLTSYSIVLLAIAVSGLFLVESYANDV